VRATAAHGVSQPQIAKRLGINARTLRRMLVPVEPPRYRRASQLDPFEPVLRRLFVEWPEIKAPRAAEILRDDYGYVRSVDLVRRRLQRLRQRTGAPPKWTGCRPGKVP
jgi:transposase